MANIGLKTCLKDFRGKIADNILIEFSVALKQYLRDIDVAIAAGQSEEHLKGILNKFLKENLYTESSFSINTDGYADMVIKKDGSLMAIFETKKPTNRADMLTVNNINKKGLWELVLYYLRSSREIDIERRRIKKIPDTEIRRLIVTDTKKFFLFDANKFDYFCRGELEEFYLKKETQQLTNNDNETFYQKVSEVFDNINITQRLDFVYFDLEELVRTKADILRACKLLSRDFFIKEKSTKITAAPLNNAFYQELLYIMGLKETKQNGKTLIQIDHTIKNSFADQVYNYLYEDKGIEDVDKVTDKTFSAIIVWINRLLFIKLFEGQLISINGDKQEYHILDNEKIKSFDDLNDLFFKILGKKERQTGEFFDKFTEIPYLNSSLFEQADVEKDYVLIKNLRNDEIKLKPRSIVKRQTALKIINYLISFLNGYSFSSKISSDDTLVQGKDIIDASVLGLVFEKINGYKDGSYYTPSTITEYICKETIEKAVIDKVNEHYHCELSNYDDLIMFASDISKKKQINEIINSLRICDPAVGSGHFLVSALNRILAIKSDLGVLFYYNEPKLFNEYEIYVEDDTLNVVDGNGEHFTYDRTSVASLKVQKTLFCEKRIIIENCLFGVDINDKAVAICQLRLWIELLKNAYYENNIMETLPNIDINIKCGNSLVSKLPVEVGKKLTQVDKELEKNITKYKSLVKQYKSESNKFIKHRINGEINNIKNFLHGRQVQLSIFSENENTSNIFENAFEWSIEFPEVLSEKGTFLGFDCVIGNPPYVLCQQSNSNKYTIKYFKEHFRVASYKIDLFHLFFERGVSLIKARGILSYITPNTYLTNKYIKPLRKFLLENCSVNKLIKHDKIFSMASVDTTTIILTKEKKENNTINILQSTSNNFEIICEKNQNDWEDNQDYIFNINEENSVETLNCITLNDVCNTYFGIQAFDKESSISNLKLNENYLPIIDGADILPYVYATPKMFFNYIHENIKSGGDWQVYSKERIVVRQIGQAPVAGLSNSGILGSNTLYSIFLKSENYKLKFILACLNSSFINNYWIAKYSDNKTLFPKIKGFQLKKLPLPIASPEQQTPIVMLVDRIIEKKKMDVNADISDLQNEINNMLDIMYMQENTDN